MLSTSPARQHEPRSCVVGVAPVEFRQLQHESGNHSKVSPTPSWLGKYFGFFWDTICDTDEVTPHSCEKIARAESEIERTNSDTFGHLAVVSCFSRQETPPNRAKLHRRSPDSTALKKAFDQQAPRPKASCLKQIRGSCRKPITASPNLC